MMRNAAGAPTVPRHLRLISSTINEMCKRHDVTPISAAKMQLVGWRRPIRRNTRRSFKWRTFVVVVVNSCCADQKVRAILLHFVSLINRWQRMTFLLRDTQRARHI